MSEKSEAQLKNEEAVRKIMAERGYDRTPVKKKKHSKKPLILSGVAVLFLAIIVVFFIVINNRDNYGKDGDMDAGYSMEETEKSSDGTDNQISEELENTTSTNDDTNAQYTPSASDVYEDRNVYYSHTDSSGTQHYTDGSTYDPHHCDALQSKYDAAKANVDALNVAWENAYKNQAPFSELYEKAGKNMELAKRWMAEEQQAVDDAMKALKEAQATANSIYQDEILPCRKEMYGQ